MKQLYTLLFLTMSITTSAQSYIPIPESNAVWIQGAFLYFVGGHEHTTITNPLSSSSDSLIGGVLYHGLQGHQIVEWVDGWGSQQNYQTGQYTLPSDTVYFRQDVPSKKVYLRYQNQDTLLYDFDLTIGQIYPETFTNYNYPNLLVMGQDSVQLLDGIYHKRWALGTDAADSGYITLIEGVGASSGLTLPLYPLFEQSGATLCMKHNSLQVYDNWISNSPLPAKYSQFCEANVSLDEIEKVESGLLVWPNPTNGKMNVYCEKNLESIEIVDMQGRLKHLETKISKDLTELNIQSLTPGYYLLYIHTSDGKIIVRKFSRN